MHTLYDFISSVNKTQYGLALLFVLGFIVFSEILKPRPFEGLAKAAADDVRFMNIQGREKSIRILRNIVLAPALAAFYLAAVPVLFVQGLAQPLGRGIGAVTSAEWSPVRAYFAGRKRTKKAKGNDGGKKASE